MNGYQYQNSKTKSHKKKSEYRTDYYNKFHLSKKYYKQCVDNSKQDIQRFFKNVDYLRKERKLFWNDIIRELNAEGIAIRRDFIQKLKAGDRVHIHFVYFQFFAIYFDVSVPYLMGSDLHAENSPNTIAEDQPEYKPEKPNSW